MGKVAASTESKWTPAVEEGTICPTDLGHTGTTQRKPEKGRAETRELTHSAP